MERRTNGETEKAKESKRMKGIKEKREKKRTAEKKVICCVFDLFMSHSRSLPLSGHHSPPFLLTPVLTYFHASSKICQKIHVS